MVSKKHMFCDWREVVDLIGDKWSVLILITLCHNTLRYSQLHKEIDGISQKVLTATLRQLERDGLVKRTVHPVVPPKVEYDLTDLGFSVFKVVESLQNWAVEHLTEIQQARAQYDGVELPKESAAATIPSVD